MTAAPTSYERAHRNHAMARFAAGVTDPNSYTVHGFTDRVGFAATAPVAFYPNQPADSALSQPATLRWSLHVARRFDGPERGTIYRAGKPVVTVFGGAR